MTCTSTEVEFLIIGDDYKANQGRAVTADFCPIENFTPGTAVGKLGFYYNDGTTEHTLIVTGGLVTDNGDGTWNVSFDIDQTDSASLVAGQYDWSIEISEAGEEVTVGKSTNVYDQIKWVTKQT